MVKRELKDCRPYNAPKHFDCRAIRLQGKEESGAENFWMGLSHFLPGGGAEFDASPTEKVYFVLEGEVTIYDENKQPLVLRKYDSLRIGPNEGRSLKNETNLTASMLVTINYPRT